MTDRRSLPVNGRVAHSKLRGAVSADRFVDAQPHGIAVPVADLLAMPGGARDRQLLFGQRFDVLDIHEGHAFGQAGRDGYVGYVAEAHLRRFCAPTHVVTSRMTQLYPAADMKQHEVATLGAGSELVVVGEQGRFARTDQGVFVPMMHIRPLDLPASDPVEVAEGFLGVSYLWGGNSAFGIDCSGLVQAVLLACGIACPGDSDQQRAALGRDLPPGTAPARGDLLFWAGHVALVRDDESLIHANAHHMAVAIEPIAVAVERISANGGGPVTAHKRLQAVNRRRG